VLGARRWDRRRASAIPEIQAFGLCTAYGPLARLQCRAKHACGFGRAGALKGCGDAPVRPGASPTAPDEKAAAVTVAGYAARGIFAAAQWRTLSIGRTGTKYVGKALTESLTMDPRNSRRSLGLHRRSRRTTISLSSAGGGATARASIDRECKGSSMRELKRRPGRGSNSTGLARKARASTHPRGSSASAIRPASAFFSTIT
jgi:hypothetical protein